MEIRRATTDSELEALLAIRNTVLTDDPVALAELRSWETQVQEMRHLIVWDGGEALGATNYGLLYTKPDPFAFVWVLPEYRCRGIGSALYAAISVWARERGKDTFEAWIEESQPDGLEFARRRGFTEIGRELRVSLDLTKGEAPRVEPPEGVTITTWAKRPDLTRGLYEVALEALPDIPGDEDEEIEPFEDWLAHEMQAGPGDRPDATFVALAGDQVVGYSKFSLSTAQPKVAHHDLTGVKRAWRGRGVARALKEAQIAWAKESGYERLETSNEERNAPIRRLNERFGYRASGARILFRGPLAD
jgi:GNAT superfamily N-acetyltransferase